MCSIIVPLTVCITSKYLNAQPLNIYGMAPHSMDSILQIWLSIQSKILPQFRSDMFRRWKNIVAGRCNINGSSKFEGWNIVPWNVNIGTYETSTAIWWWDNLDHLPSENGQRLEVTKRKSIRGLFNPERKIIGTKRTPWRWASKCDFFSRVYI